MSDLPFQRLRKIAEEHGSSPVDEFFSAGIDYHGQSQIAYTQQGGGLAAEFKIDPGKIIGLTASIGVNVGVDRCREVLLIAMRHPMAFSLSSGRLVNETPMLMGSFIGVQWVGSIGASLEVGLSFEAGWGSSKGSETKWTGKEEEEEEEDGHFSLEMQALEAKFEAKVGLTAEASYTYENMYAESPLLAFFGDDEKAEMRTFTEEVLGLGSIKAMVKKGACDFINQNSRYFGTISYDTLFGHTSSNKISQQLHRGLAGLSVTNPQQKKIRREALEHIAFLEPWAEGVQTRGACFLRISSHKVTGSIGVGAKAEATVAIPIARAGAEVGLKGPTLEGTRKRAYVRFQTFAHAQDRSVWCTQDTVITYAQIKFTLLKLSGKAEARTNIPFFGKSVSTEQLGEGGKKAAEGVGPEWDIINRMSYASTVVYWQPPPGFNSEKVSASVDKQVDLLPGSGITFGQSVTVENLASCVEGLLTGEASGDRFATAMAASLSVSPEQVKAFLKNDSVSSIILSLAASGQKMLEQALAIDFSPQKEAEARRKGQRALFEFNKLKEKAMNADIYKVNLSDKALLVEATYAAPPGMRAKATWTRKYQSNTFSKDTVEDTLLLDPAVRSTLIDHSVYKDPARRNNLLQAMRLRFRIQDLDDSSSDFGLGFKLFGQELGIKLKKIERAGSEGIVDLCTIWMAGGLAVAVEDRELKSKYEVSVPPPTLFCQ